MIDWLIGYLFLCTLVLGQNMQKKPNGSILYSVCCAVKLKSHSAVASFATFLFLPHFDVLCDLLKDASDMESIECVHMTSQNLRNH